MNISDVVTDRAWAIEEDRHRRSDAIERAYERIYANEWEPVKGAWAVMCDCIKDESRQEFFADVLSANWDSDAHLGRAVKQFVTEWAQQKALKDAVEYVAGAREYLEDR